jgi:hypothetical protein
VRVKITRPADLDEMLDARDCFGSTHERGKTVVDDYSSTGEMTGRGFERIGEELEAASRGDRGHNPERRPQ